MAKRTVAIGIGAWLAFAALTGAQTWTPLTHQPPFNANVALLLTDGTVMVKTYLSGDWWRLTPSNTGSYVNGTWSQLASMPAGYGPLYFASAVLRGGRVVIEGGEYNLDDPGSTAMGALYDPVANAWTSIAPPSGWDPIADAQSVILPNGTFMLADIFSGQAALLNTSTLTWTLTGTGKADVNDEEGWTLLPNGKVLTVDTNNFANLLNSEIYDPATGMWSSAGSTIVKLPDTNLDGSGSYEIGPAVLRPDGTVFATGGTSQTSIYNASTGVWQAGPSFPNGLDVADGPAAILPSGNVLVDTSPGVFQTGVKFFEFNGTSLTAVPAPPNAPFESSYVGNMLVLPTGQILFTDGSSDIEIYTASGTYQSAWQPTISSFPASVRAGAQDYSLSGTQLNGLSQGAAYGDDAQSASNYPLVRITNNATGHVFYARTHSHSTMGVATGAAVVSTQFDVPAGIETGSSTLRVVANGIPSNPVSVQVLPPSGTDYYTIQPCRLVDTRIAGSGGPLLSNVPRTFTAAGACGVPTDAVAVACNLAAVAPPAGGYVTLYAGGGAVPTASTINFNPGVTLSNNAIVPLATNGAGTIGAQSLVGAGGGVDVVIDVVGYFK